MGIESALIGAGIGAKTAAFVSSASTIFSGLSAASSLFGGVSANRESQRQAVTAQAEANLRAEETARAGAREAQFVGMEAESVRRRQKLAYLKSGVDLEGSPLLMMEATRRNGLDNVEETLRASKSTAGAQVVEGRARASQLKSSGRQAFMSGIGNAAGSLSRIF